MSQTSLAPQEPGLQMTSALWVLMVIMCLAIPTQSRVVARNDTVNVLKIRTVKYYFWTGKYQKSCEGSNQLCKGRQLNCLPLQNLLLLNCRSLQNWLLPSASLVRREYKFRVFSLFLVFEILENLPNHCLSLLRMACQLGNFDDEASWCDSIVTTCRLPSVFSVLQFLLSFEFYIWSVSRVGGVGV